MKTTSYEDRWAKRQEAMRLKMQVIEAYAKRRDMVGNPLCAALNCPISDLNLLTIDHIKNGDGAAHRKLIGGSGNTTYRWLRQKGFPPGFQVLCANHHLLKTRCGSLDRVNEEIIREELEGIDIYELI